MPSSENSGEVYQTEHSKPSSAQELRLPRVQIIRFAQKFQFQSEIYNFNKSKLITNGSKVAPLKRFLDENGILWGGQ